MAEGMTVDELALDLGFLQDDDLRVLLSEMVDLPDEYVPVEWCVELRWVLDPNGERTAAAPFYWTGHPTSFEGESPTAPEGFCEDW